MFKTTTRKVIVAIATFLIAIFGGTQLLGSAQSTTITLAGTSDNAIQMPKFPVDAANTTTAGFAKGGLFQQQFNTERFETFAMDVLSIGGTATSSGYYELQSSFDGINFFNVSGTSTSTDKIGTTTLSMSNSVFNITPGVASSSNHYIFSTQGASQMRLIMYSDNLATDPNDGVQAWVTITKIMENR